MRLKDGSNEPLDEAWLLHDVSAARAGLDGVSAEAVMTEVRRNLYDGIQLHELGVAQTMEFHRIPFSPSTMKDQGVEPLYLGPWENTIATVCGLCARTAATVSHLAKPMPNLQLRLDIVRSSATLETGKIWMK